METTSKTAYCCDGKYLLKNLKRHLTSKKHLEFNSNIENMRTKLCKLDIPTVKTYLMNLHLLTKYVLPSIKKSLKKDTVAIHSILTQDCKKHILRFHTIKYRDGRPLKKNDFLNYDDKWIITNGTYCFSLFIRDNPRFGEYEKDVNYIMRAFEYILTDTFDYVMKELKELYPQYAEFKESRVFVDNKL
jgi:hypothetical protein